MNEASLVNNLPLNGDLRPLRIGDEVAPIELSKSQVRIQNLDVTGSFNIAGQDDNLLDRDGTNTYLKNTGDNFGIGTTSPSYPLDVRKSLTASTYNVLASFMNTNTSSTVGGMIRIADYNSTSDTGYSTDVGYDSDGYGFIRANWTNDANAMKIQATAGGGSIIDVATFVASGNVGIGTTSPVTAFHIKDGGTSFPNLGAGILLENTTGSTDLKKWHIYSNDDSLCFLPSNDADSTAEYAYRITSDVAGKANAHIWSSHVSSTVAERMRIHTNGNVGIGTSSPDTLLDVENSDAGGHASVRIARGNTAGSANVIFASADDGYTDWLIGTPDSDDWGDGTDFFIGRLSGSFTNAKLVLDINSYISLSNNDSGTSNTVFGKNAGLSIDAGSNYNVFIGEAVSDATMNDATNNVGVGYQALSALTTGDSNVVIGSTAGDAMSTHNYNVVIGTNAFGAAASGEEGNTLVGHYAGSEINNGSSHYNVILGYTAGQGGTGAMLNCVAIGMNAMNSTDDQAQTGTVAIGASALTALTSGGLNTAIGYQVMDGLTTGGENTAVGYGALSSVSLGENTNVAIGTYAMRNMNEGTAGGDIDGNIAIGYDAFKGGNLAGDDRQIQDNIAIGRYALDATNTASHTGTVAIGGNALTALTSGGSNTAIGYEAGYGNQTGAGNTFVGYTAGRGSNAVHSDNTGVGKEALYTIATGLENVAIGKRAGYLTTNVDASVLIGYNAGAANMTSAADGTVAIGHSALKALTSGGKNTAIGYQSGDAMTDNSENVMLGYGVLSAADAGESYNVAIGYNSMNLVNNGTDAQENVAIGHVALKGGESTGGKNVAIGSTAMANAGNYASSVVAIGYTACNGVMTSAADGTVAIGRQALTALTSGASNLAIGYQALLTHTTGSRNMAIGYGAMNDTDASSTTQGSNDNVFIGYSSGGGTWSTAESYGNVGLGNYALDDNLDGALYNTALGYAALSDLETGDDNVAIGVSAGQQTVAVSDTVLIGRQAGASVMTAAADGTVAVGYQALTALTSGAQNIAIGYQAMLEHTTGCCNIAIGYGAMNDTGANDCPTSTDNIFIGTNAGGGTWATNDSNLNIGIGSYALYGAMNGAGNNIAIGYRSLYVLTTGDENVSIGRNSGDSVTEGVGNTFIGMEAGDNVTTGSSNVTVGKNADPSAIDSENQIVIGTSTTGQADNSVTLGNASVTAVYMAQDSGATVHCGDINVQYDFIRSALDYNQSAGTLVTLMLDGGTRPKTTFVGNLETTCMIAPHDGTLEFISFRAEEVAGIVVMGFHKATTGTEVPSDTPTASVTIDMSGVADDTTTKFAFTSSNTFSAGDVLGFSIDPASDIDDCLFVITLKYDTTT